MGKDIVKREFILSLVLLLAFVFFLNMINQAPTGQLISSTQQTPFQFSLSVVPEITVLQRGTTTAQPILITVHKTAGTTSLPVTVSATNLPSGVTAQITPTSLCTPQPNCVLQLTLTASSAATLGFFTVQIVGIDSNNVQHNVPFSLTVQQSSPGSLSFQTKIIDQTTTGGDCKAVGDLNGDGFVDAVLGNLQLNWYSYSSWNKRLIASASTEFSTDCQTADFDRDGDLDIVVPDGGSGNNILWFQNGNQGSSWTKRSIGAQTPSGRWAHDVEVGDVDNDGDIDVITRGGSGTGELNFWRNPGSGWTSVITPIKPSTRSGEGLALGDIDKDGDLDIVLNGYWLEQQSPTTWREYTIDSSWSGTYVGAHVADVNNDGKMDILLAPSESSGQFAWYESSNPKGGTWTKHTISTSVNYVHTFKTGDIDLDGDLDVIFAEMHTSSTRRVGAYLNNGGLLPSWTYFSIDSNKVGSHNIRVVDVEGDSDLDVIGANYIDAGKSPNPAAWGYLYWWENKVY